jgi:two-component system, NarL family, sensor histidine kinase UhpB
MSLRLRLNLIITLLMLLFMLAVGFILIKSAKSATQESVEAATHVTTQLLDAVILSASNSLDFGYSNGVMKRFLEQLGRVRSNEIYLYDYSNQVIYKSPTPEYRSDVKPPKWFNDLLDPKAEPVVRFIRLGKLGRLEVRPNPSGTIRESWAKLQKLFWIWLGFFIALNAGVYWVLGSLLKPLQPILKTINQLEQGDLRARLPHFKSPEFEKIGHSLNRMAESLAVERELEESRQVTHLIQKHIEEERRSLARELHDELGQYVTAIKTFAVAIASKTKEKAPEVEASAQTIVAAANHIYDGMHNIIKQLRPGSLDNLGLPETLKDLVNSLQEQHQYLQVRLNLTGNLEVLGETLNINLYRMIQESINNAIKHAQATTLDINLKLNDENALELVIKDNGKGMDIHAVDQTNHFGLLGIRERVQGLHGRFSVESELGNGTAIIIKIPNVVKIGTQE